VVLIECPDDGRLVGIFWGKEKTDRDVDLLTPSDRRVKPSPRERAYFIKINDVRAFIGDQH
jgi:hypothetical protein